MNNFSQKIPNNLLGVRELAYMKAGKSQDCNEGLQPLNSEMDMAARELHLNESSENKPRG